MSHHAHLHITGPFKFIGVSMFNFLNYTLLCFFAAMSSSAQAIEIIKVTTTQQKSLHLEVSPIQSSTTTTSQRVPGEIVVPVGQFRVISAPQPGLIDEVMVATGHVVRKGQVLAHLSSPDLVALQRDHLQALSQQRLSQNSLNRDSELYKDGIIAERRFLTTQSSHNEVNALLAERRQALKLSGMSDQAINKLESSGRYASGMSLVAPIDGVVLEQMVTTGQRIDSSMPVYRIAKLNPLWLEMHAPVQILNGINLGMKVSIANIKATGKVIAVVRNVNKMDQTALIRAEITSGTDLLSPGQLVEAEIGLQSMQGNFKLPKAAVFQKPNGKDSNDNYVFVVSQGGFEPRKVSLVSVESTQAIVQGSFDGSEQVVVNGTAALKAIWQGLGSE